MSNTKITNDVWVWLRESAKEAARFEQEAFEFDMYRVIQYGNIKSPIEQAFYAGLFSVAKHSCHELVPHIREPFHTPKDKSTRYSDEGEIELHIGSSDIHCWPQCEIGRYRADFVLAWRHTTDWSAAVVELDGHAWHDRDEKQRRYEKRRDREMQSLGFRVARFTGSEVWKDPYRCACESLHMLAPGEEAEFITPKEYWGH